MRFLLFVTISAALIGVGCSSTKKSEAPAAAAAAAPKQAENSKASAAKPGDGTKVECSHKGDTRTLELRAKGAGCELAYTKAGKEGVVASAAHGKDYCQKAFDKLQDKLKGAGYDCK
jgi:hypothetical protein